MPLVVNLSPPRKIDSMPYVGHLRPLKEREDPTSQPNEPAANTDLAQNEDLHSALGDTESLPLPTDHNLAPIILEAATTSETVAGEESATLQDDGRDSGYSGDSSEDSVSVTSSVMAGVHKYGREYQDPDKYPFPRDEEELDYLDFVHYVFRNRFMAEKLHYAPLDKFHNVLDLGTGTGIWAIEFAEKYPEACVLGIDICCSQPTFVPPNCKFQIVDAEEEWDFRRKFNFIHIRNPTGFQFFKNTLSNAYQSLVSGGWLEIQDIKFPLLSDGDDGGDPAHLRLWEKDVLDGARHLQYDLEKPYQDLMRDQGFKEIKCVMKTWPIWRNREMDQWLLELTLRRIKSYSLIHLLEGPEAEIWTLTGVQAYIARVKKDIKDHKSHLSLQTIVIYGQK